MSSLLGSQIGLHCRPRIQENTYGTSIGTFFLVLSSFAILWYTTTATHKKKTLEPNLWPKALWNPSHRGNLLEIMACNSPETKHLISGPGVGVFSGHVQDVFGVLIVTLLAFRSSLEGKQFMRTLLQKITKWRLFCLHPLSRCLDSQATIRLYVPTFSYSVLRTLLFTESGSRSFNHQRIIFQRCPTKDGTQKTNILCIFVS